MWFLFQKEDLENKDLSGINTEVQGSPNPEGGMFILHSKEHPDTMMLQFLGIILNSFKPG